MAFVKLDCGMLNSTIWVDRVARELFITALLMAEPFELREAAAEISVRSLDFTGFVVPPGWYGFVPAAGSGIIRRAGLDEEDKGLTALERLAAPDSESRTPEHEGRRMVRIDGGYLILNYDKYRQKDHTAAERAKRYRERKAKSRVTNAKPRVTTRNVTQVEGEGEGEAHSEGEGEGKRKAQPVGYAVPSCFESVDGFSVALGDWIESRKQMKKPATAKAIQMTINELAKRPQDAVSALNMAVKNGWQGIEWEWFDKRNPRGNSHSIRENIKVPIIEAA